MPRSAAMLLPAGDNDESEFADIELIAPLGPDTKPSKVQRPRRRGLVAFVIVVALPMMAATFYYAFVAAGQYVSETRFVIRNPQRLPPGLFSGFLQGTGFARSQDDSFAVSEFVRSRSAVLEINRDGMLDELFSRPEADALARYPAFWQTASDEALYRQYLRSVTISTDNTSGVTTLEALAFRAADAQRLALALLQRAEDLINRLNDRARGDAVRYASEELRESEARLSQAQAHVTAFRNREALVDPDKQSTAILEAIAKLSLDAAEKRARLAEIERQAAESPQVTALRQNIAAIEEQIRQQRQKVVGGDSSIAPRIATYEQLALEQELATRMVTSANTSLQNARMEAQRQQIYLERIVDPNLPDRPSQPKAIRSLLLVLMVLLSVYGIGRMVLDHLYEHFGP